MGLREFIEDRIGGLPEQSGLYINVGDMRVEIGQDGLLHLSEDQINQLRHEHRGTIKPFIATQHPDGTYTLEVNTKRKNI